MIDLSVRVHTLKLRPGEYPANRFLRIALYEAGGGPMILYDEIEILKAKGKVIGSVEYSTAMDHFRARSIHGYSRITYDRSEAAGWVRRQHEAYLQRLPKIVPLHQVRAL